MILQFFLRNNNKIVHISLKFNNGNDEDNKRIKFPLES